MALRLRIPSPLFAIEVLGGYSAAGAMMFLGFKGYEILPRVVSEDRYYFASILNELNMLCAVVLWLWVTAFFVTRVWSAARGAGVFLAFFSSLAALAGGVSLTLLAFLVLLVDQIDYLNI